MLNSIWRDMHRRIKQPLLYLALGVSISGCMFTSDNRQSMPYGTGIQGQMFHEKIKLSDLDVHVMARNAVIMAESTCLFPATSSREKMDAFGIRVAFLPYKPGFTVNLYNILLSVEETANIRPVKYLYLPHSKDSKEWARKSTNQGFVVCGSWERDYEFKEIDRLPHILSDIGLWNCFELLYEIQPPDPKLRISLSIKGVEKGTRNYEIPAIDFREKYYRYRDFAP